MNTCYLGLGSNLSSPQRKLHQAVSALAKMPSSALLQQSPVYHSKPWGVSAQPDYYNMVIKLKTFLTPHQLLAHCQGIENKMGRVRKKRWGARTIDIDVLLYGDRKLNTAHLIIPHPYMLQRDFVLLPLLAMSPGLKLPDGQRISVYLKNCKAYVK